MIRYFCTKVTRTGVIMLKTKIQAVVLRLYFTVCFFSFICLSFPVGNKPFLIDNERIKSDTETAIDIPASMKNCSLYPKHLEEQENIAQLVTDGIALVKISVIFEGSSGPLSDENVHGHMFRPFNWIILTSLTGQRMLLLKEHVLKITMEAFGYGIRNADLSLVQSPFNCLEGKSQIEVENSMRRLFLRNFEPNGTLLSGEAKICNRHVNKRDRVGRIEYMCCHENFSKELECSAIERSDLMKGLFMIISILKWISMSCFPLLFPYYVYKSRNEFREYIYKRNQDEELNISIMKVKELSEEVSKMVKESKVHSFTQMKIFKDQVKTKVLDINRKYTCSIKEILITERNSNLQSRRCAPVSLLEFLSNFFVRCKLRHTIYKGDECFNGNVFKCMGQQCSRKYTWYRCLRFLMVLVTFIVFLLPIEFRLLCYRLFEHNILQEQKDLLAKHNMSMYAFTTEIIEHPITHVLSSDLWFIIMIYPLILLLCLVLQMPYFSKSKENLLHIFRKSVRDMRSTIKSELCSIYLGKSVWLLHKLGIPGLLIFPFWFILLCIPLTIEIIPTFNFIGRLVINYQELHSHLESKGKISYIFSVTMIVFVLLLVLVIVMECMSFYVELTIYIIVGFILNSNLSLRYVSMIILIGIYGHECFSAVFKRYESYNNAIIAKVTDMIGEQLREVASLSKAEQDNTAYTIRQTIRKQENKEKYTLTAKETETKCNMLFPCMRLQEDNNGDLLTIRTRGNIFELSSEGFLKLRLPRLVLFMDNSDEMYVPKRFLFKMAELPHHLCPGPVHLLYLKAFLDFSVIVTFLAFVFMIILGFGQAQDISSGGQTIAALGGGLVPLFLRRILFRSHVTQDVNVLDLQWRFMFENAVQKYSEIWNFVDISLSDCNCSTLDPFRLSNTGHTDASNATDGSDVRQDNVFCTDSSEYQSPANNGQPLNTCQADSTNDAEESVWQSGVSCKHKLSANSDQDIEPGENIPLNPMNTSTYNISDIDLIIVENEGDLKFYVTNPGICNSK